MVGERLSSSGTRLDAVCSSSPVQYVGVGSSSKSFDSTVSTRVGGGVSAIGSTSRQSLIDIVGCRLGVGAGSGGTGGTGGGGGGKRFSRDSLGAGYVNRAHTASSELDISRKTREARRRDIRGRLRLERWEPSSCAGAGTSGATGGGVTGITNSGTFRVSNRTGANSTGGGSGSHSGHGMGNYTKNLGCRWSFVFDPAGRLCYYWSMVVSLAFLYNFWVLIYRFAFQEITRESLAVWFCLDYFSDLLYLLDIAVHFRTGYLEDGVLQTDATKLRHHYMNSTTFYIDCLCLLPLDFLYLSIGFNSILRSFRLVKIYRFWAFMDRTERHTNYPNLFRATSLIHYLLVIFHWNGCLYHIIYKNNGFGSKNWVFGDSENADVVKQYLQSYYWCTLALTTIGDLPRPRSKGEYLFVIAQLLFGLMLFATVLGHVANIVTNVSAARKEFQGKYFFFHLLFFVIKPTTLTSP
jgi:cyclic nucleotide gated channel alpha 3